MSTINSKIINLGSGILKLTTSSCMVARSLPTLSAFWSSSAKVQVSLDSLSPKFTGILTFNNGNNNVGGNYQSIRHSAQTATLAKIMQTAAKPLVICGPSGAGKSSVVNQVTKDFPECFGLCVSHTTRKPRPSETDGVDYHFVPKDVFQDVKDRGEFVETAEYAGNMYGTSRGAIKKKQMAGLICVLDIELLGVQQIKKTPGLEPHYVFIRPPSLAELEVRLRARKTESEDSIKKRLAVAEEEMKLGDTENYFDLVITNDTLDNAASKLRDFMLVHIEELKRSKHLLAQK